MENKIKIFNFVDTNCDNTIEQDEFIAIFNDNIRMNDELSIEYAFSTMDKQGKKEISVKCLKEFLINHNIILKETNLDEIFNNLEVNVEN